MISHHPEGSGQTVGKLYLIGTPLGNLEDITLRAKRILQEVDLVAAEDTRRAGLLLQHLGLSKRIISYHEHNERSRSEELVEMILQGVSVGVVSDAGMPGISDPGRLLVLAAVSSGIPVIPVPGPTAATTALVMSGLDSKRYVFEGFIPRSGKPRKDRLQELAQERRTMVIYEAPHRLRRTLADLHVVLGDRAAAVARELTKLHEECIRASIAELVRHFEITPPRGECVIVVAGMDSTPGVVPHEDEARPDQNVTAQLLFAQMQRGLSRKDAVRVVATETGLPRREVYQVSLTVTSPTCPEDKGRS